MRIRADEAVAREDVLLGKVGHDALPEAVVALLGDGLVEAAPPDLVVAAGLVDDELVLGRAAGVLAGPHHERAVGGEQAFLALDGLLVQGRDGQVRVARAAEQGLRTVSGETCA